MYLNTAILNKYNAGSKIIQRFSELYPDGQEFSKIIQDRRAPSELLHWGYEFLSLDEEEKGLYQNRLNIVNCEDFLYSKNIENCTNILNSRNCKNSNQIKHSFYVEDSTQVFDSKRIKSSSLIFDSKDIKKSISVIQSSSIFNSQNIYASNQIYNSNSIFRSDNIFTSLGIRKSENILESFFCSDCEKSTYLMFCYDLVGEDYYLFNQPISSTDFFAIQEELFEHFDFEFNFFSIAEDLSVNQKEFYEINENYPDHYKSLSKEFYTYLETLPGYDPFIMYMITLDTNFLV